MNFFYRNEKTFTAHPFHERFNKYVTQWTDSFNKELEFRETLRSNSAKILKTRSVLDNLIDTFRETYLSQIRDKNFLSSTTPTENGEKVELELFKMCRNTMFKASCYAVFGPEFPCDEINDDYKIFENNISTFVKGFPRITNPKAFDARARVSKHLAEFFNNPEKTGKSSDLIRSHIQTFQNNANVDTPENRAAYMFGILFASASNVVPAAFWMVAHALAHPGLADTIRDIIRPHYDPETDSFNWEELYANEFFKSMISETLRLHSNITNARFAESDTDIPIGEHGELKTVKKGEIVIIVSDLIHWDAEVYPDPFTWVPDRFLPSQLGISNKSEKTWKSFTPWGGGMHTCSGRAFALNEMIVQLCLVFWYFDIELIKNDPRGKLPEAYIKERFGLGVAHPETPMWVKVGRRNVQC